MTDQEKNTLVEHLEELRGVLIRCLIALAIGFVPMFFCAPSVLDALIKIILQKCSVTLNFFSPMELFVLQMKMAMVLDILICFPFMVWQMWHFILPALYEHERRFIKSLVGLSSLLFVVGSLFCLFFILPSVMRFGLSFMTGGIQPVLGIGAVISLVLRLTIIFGVMFQFPIVTYALIQAGIIEYNTVKNKRAAVLVGILILSGLLTPPDIISQVMLTIPTYSLFEIGLFLARKHSSGG